MRNVDAGATTESEESGIGSPEEGEFNLRAVSQPSSSSSSRTNSKAAAAVFDAEGT
jgi:hypothetical protein